MSKKDDFYFEVKDVLYSINYIYYSIYFLLFVGVQLLHVGLISQEGGFFRNLYMVYAGLEVFVEVLLMAAISSWLLLHSFRKWHLLFVLVTVLLLFCRIIDFLLVRLMDLSVWQGMEFAMQWTFTEFLESLYASNIPISVWLISASLLIVALVLGIGLFSFTEKLCKKREFLCSAKKIFGCFAFACSLIAFSDIFFHLEVDDQTLFEYTKALPWKRTLLPEEENLLTVGENLKMVPKGEVFLQDIDSNMFALERKPDFFLFITESLRDDFLTEEVTPYLATFKKDNVFFPKALSVANATHISWFSTFYSLYPFYWDQYQSNQWKGGSPSLSLLKKMGYEIRVYASSRLSYYDMDHVLFGENKQAVDVLREFQTKEVIPAYLADKRAIDAVCDDVRNTEQRGGRVFIVFLDSTHFDYSWPEKDGNLFSPVSEKINYLKLSYSRDNLDNIKNRYKNSLHYVDGLFHLVQESLEEKGLWEDSVYR